MAALEADSVNGKNYETKPKYRLFLEKLVYDWSLDYSAMIAYSLLVSLVPIAVALFGILAIVLGNDNSLQDKIKTRIITSFPNETRDGLTHLLDMAFNQLSKDAGIILAIGIIFAVIVGSRLFVAIDDCLTIIYRTQERTFLRQNILAIKTLFLFIVLILLMIATSSAPSVFLGSIPGTFGRTITFIAGFLTSLGLSFLLFEFIYHFIPNKPMTLKQTWCGALLAGILLQIYLILFPLYATKFMTNYAGQIGFAVILLLFFYYFAAILILGAQINAFFYEQIQPFPCAFGTFIQNAYNEHINGEGRQLLAGSIGDVSYSAVS